MPIGIRRAPEQAIPTQLSKGWIEMSFCLAATTAIGMMISDVAVLEMTCPMMAASTKSPARRA